MFQPLHLFLVTTLIVNLWSASFLARPALADGEFTNINANLVGVEWGKLSWGDYDNDGDLDVLLTGCDDSICSSYITRIYRNDGGVFTNVPTALPGVGYGAAGLGRL